ncbi:MAG: 16S rRNA (adenine(1518)-N(6)/adenine(1519)-N(6))-dimethyltransferase RsmA [Vicinamibacterales bacterium]|nr:16S rRNA (adenine(1518)-N(6)/adenine(1519)-N(6))-dimethyltransferase RsmA [Vicinamibacterales bacterium]
MIVRRRFGQHFLEPVWADKVVRAIAPLAGDTFLEIGPGQGILTVRLAPKVRQLVAIEIDRDLIATLTPKLPSNASIVSGDILDIDLTTLVSDDPVRIAGNLPYNISSPILFRLLDLQTHRPVRDATLMLQREVVDRIVAKPGSSEYGVLSVLVQWQASVARLLTLPPGAFRPPPKVASAVVRLAFETPKVGVRDRRVFTSLVRSIFTQRRKTLSNALAPFAAEMGASSASALREAGIDPTRRPQTLEIVEIARLADIFAAAVR